jgi:O-acetylserine/cysteine efflux transporter
MTAFEKLLVSCVAILWGGNFVIIRWGIEEVDPIAMTALRFAFVALPAIFFVPRPTIALPVVALYGLLFGGGVWGLVNLAVFLGTPAGSASLLLQLSAFLTVIAALIFFRESISRLKIISLICAFIGFAVISFFRSDALPFIGLITMFIAALSWTACNILIKKFQPNNVLSFIIWSSIFVPIPVILFPLLQSASSGDLVGFFDQFVILGVKGWTSVLFQSFLTTMVGYGIWTWAITRHGLVNVAPYSLLVPVSGLLFGWLFYNEVMSVSEVTGTALILFGLILLFKNDNPNRHLLAKNFRPNKFHPKKIKANLIKFAERLFGVFQNIGIYLLFGSVVLGIFALISDPLMTACTDNYKFCPTFMADEVRNYLIAFGGLAGIYGLALAYRRQKEFSRQVDQGQNQLVSEQLGRAVEQLAHKNISIRSAGVRVLEDMVNGINQDQRVLIAKILKDFLETSVILPKSSTIYSSGRVPSRSKRLDIELAVNALIKIQHRYDVYDFKKREKLRFENYDLRGLHFENLEMLPLKIFFKDCNMENCTFKNIRVTDIIPDNPNTLIAGIGGLSIFQDSNLRNSTFSKCSFKYASINNCSFSKSRFETCRFMIVFGNCEMIHTELTRCDLSGASFGPSPSGLAPLRFSSLKDCDISDTRFYYPTFTGRDQGIIDQAFYEHDKRPLFYDQNPQGQILRSNQPSVHRGYEWDKEKRIRSFVESNEDHSGQKISPFPWERKNPRFPFDDPDDLL